MVAQWECCCPGLPSEPTPGVLWAECAGHQRLAGNAAAAGGKSHAAGEGGTNSGVHAVQCPNVCHKKQSTGAGRWLPNSLKVTVTHYSLETCFFQPHLGSGWSSLGQLSVVLLRCCRLSSLKVARILRTIPCASCGHHCLPAELSTYKFRWRRRQAQNKKGSNKQHPGCRQIIK
jgi:hypothetical protein